MPLHDHFNPPLTLQEEWQSFHHAWATVMAFDLNTRLPTGYYAQPVIRLGVVTDLSALRLAATLPASGGYDPGTASGTVSVAAALDTAAVQVISSEAGPVLVGAIELVSPSNKDRPAEREAFVGKCAALLHRQVGLIVVDPVTTRRSSLHLQLIGRLDSRAHGVLDADLYAVSYRAQPDGEHASVSYWEHALALGAPLPVLPFWLRDLCIPLDLDATYQRTWQGLHMDVSANGAA